MSMARTRAEGQVRSAWAPRRRLGAQHSTQGIRNGDRDRGAHPLCPQHSLLLPAGDGDGDGDEHAPRAPAMAVSLLARSARRFLDGPAAAHRFPKNDIVVRAAVYVDVLCVGCCDGVGWKQRILTPVAWVGRVACQPARVSPLPLSVAPMASRPYQTISDQLNARMSYSVLCALCSLSHS